MIPKGNRFAKRNVFLWMWGKPQHHPGDNPAPNLASSEVFSWFIIATGARCCSSTMLWQKQHHTLCPLPMLRRSG